MFDDVIDNDLPYMHGNCRFYDEWSGECTCPASDQYGQSLRETDEACYEWEPVGTVTIEAEGLV